MWDVMLSGAGGTLAAVTVWWLFAGLSQRGQPDLVSRRLQRLESRGTPTPLERLAVFDWHARYSTLPVLRDFIYRVDIGSATLSFLEQAGSSMNVGTYLLLHVCCFAAGILVVLWMGFPLPIVFFAGVGMGVLPLMVMAAKRRKRFAQITAQLPDAVRLIASSMRAGLGLESGLNIVASELQDPIQSEFMKLLNEWRLSGDMIEAFRHLARRVPSSDVSLFVSAACLNREIGGNFAEMLDQLEHTIRERAQLFRELKTLTAESRMSGWVLGILPFVVALGLFVLNSDYIQVLLDRENGRIMLWAALAMQLTGFGLIRWLTHPKIR